ncbi:Carbohydrate-binding family 9 [Cohnella sp. OV330]|uniref:carbohydrate-binding family 9-like protein n=1 Tax=Cohnella sp. OV330 TaxID=1855288 RepID=UPI0008DF99D4|nr:carbohydrate-binding family 9-like protein [Cohnella sp. OV330]SFB02220.1 Carbohydrate-binding family 9 [Cohnella sp. OV330]
MAESHRVQYHAEELGDAQWDAIPPLHIAHFLWETAEEPYRPEVQVRLYYTDEALYARFRTYESDPVAIHNDGFNPTVYQDSCVEFFLQPAPDQDPRYLNFEFNSNGSLLLGLGVNRENRDQTPGHQPSHYGIQAERGLLDEHGHVYWQLSFRIPFAVLADWFPSFTPSDRMAMKGNFYKCGDLTPRPHYASWSDIPEVKPDFHRSQYFGSLIFER